MSATLNIKLQYYENARVFLQYRSGQQSSVTSDQFTKAINTNGYCKLTAGKIIVLLVDELSPTANRIENFRMMLKDAIKWARMANHPIEEIICSIMMTCSNKPKKRITSFEHTFRVELAELHLRRPVFSASGLFAFNPLARAFARDDRYAKNIPGSVLLRCGVLSDEQKALYNHRYGLTNMPTVQQNEIECIWNNYYEGEIIWTENLSPTTIGAIMVRRVTAPTTNHIKDAKDTPEEEENDE